MERKHLLGALAGVAVVAILLAERRRPSRPVTQPEPRRTARNVALGLSCMAVVTIVEKPLIERLTAMVERRRFGLAQSLPAPLRDIAGFLLLDWAMYGWHVATHRSPILWQLHLVHHSDGDMDASTALRFHFADMLVSLPFRLAQVAVAGAGPRAHRAWQRFFFLSVLFHHSRIRLSPAAERRLSRLLTTPGMHDVHHRADPATLNSNWSSGLAWWDHLHGTFRASAPPLPIGAPGCETDLSLGQLIALPLRSPTHAKPPPSQLSHELREETSPDLTRRRWSIGLSLVGAAIGGVVTAYQTGLIKRLPDILPGRNWDAEKVDASDYAYRRMQTPDATMMLGTYALTAGLIAAGGKDRAEQAPALPIAAAVKALFDFVTCVKLGREEWAENKALCSWCQVATLVSAATVALTLPEAVRASKALA